MKQPEIDMSTHNLKLVRIPRVFADKAKSIGRARGITTPTILNMALEAGLPLAEKKAAQLAK